MSPLAAVECASCGRVAFPMPLLCRRCGGFEWRPRALAAGVVEETTTVHRMPGGGPAAPVRLGSVRLDEGPVIVARLEGGVRAGDRVRVDGAGGGPVAHLLRD